MKSKGSHTITMHLSPDEYAALRRATAIQCGPREPGDEIGFAELRRFIRIATHAAALATIRAGEIPADRFAVDIRIETLQEYRERLHMLSNPEKINLEHLGVDETRTDPADWWKKTFRRN